MRKCKWKTLVITLSVLLCQSLNAQQAVTSKGNQARSSVSAQLILKNIKTPLDVVKTIGDKLIRETPFQYNLSVAAQNTLFNDMQFIDFGRTFFPGRPAVAYAFTNLEAAEDMEMPIQIEHNDGCKIWLNGELVYQRKGNRKINLVYDERSIEMKIQCKLKLRKGKNDLLIKSETRGNQWRVYLQPPSKMGAVVSKEFTYPQIGLSHTANVDSTVAKLSNWLVIGPFQNPVYGIERKGLDILYAPEKEFHFGKMYQGLNEEITWTIPKVEVLGTMIDSKDWGTNYNWNYHNGGVAWAMEQLAEVSGDKKYNDYATNFCNFHLNGIPFVKYQVQTLNAKNSANSYIINTPLLDFTLAPSLPIIYKLRKEHRFSNREKYEGFISSMIDYAEHKQVRLPGANNFTRTTPENYTTWTDDMFMGIPFLVQASQYVKEPAQKKALLNDAAHQIIAFNSQVWDSEANLYVHARYSNRNVKLPHWSRANGWGIWAMTEVLMVLPTSHPLYKVIMQQYKKQVSSLAKLQNKDGFWYNVLDRVDSREEVSGTSMFTMAIARGVNHGWLDAKNYMPVAMKGWDAIQSQIEADGTVHNICMGTMCSEDVNYYLNRPFYDNDTHGLLAVLFAGMEISKMLTTHNF
jgi:unsaturated rhamnogalacturonyl hydrolase